MTSERYRVLFGARTQDDLPFPATFYASRVLSALLIKRSFLVTGDVNRTDILVLAIARVICQRAGQFSVHAHQANDRWYGGVIGHEEAYWIPTDPFTPANLRCEKPFTTSLSRSVLAQAFLTQQEVLLTLERTNRRHGIETVLRLTEVIRQDNGFAAIGRSQFGALWCIEETRTPDVFTVSRLNHEAPPARF